ncbi:aromatic ring-hydroxylating oxygenase subunit alpha [Vitreoscilla stercoraria]|uniref:Aromatic ring-hydroxylating dioxygenase subunit alpha n=1 Tax=Vitreoscilla stercoraria TaxID=61 RepID=A0ABY4EB12_VITST|nr:aromatic ring-hydroxylating dioxygenase subunit alpha [Vitreoscilla stercoraria]UOO92518.1 aromatic ring-hydroxylating dioxygenase subunit alpha [Vitreoscilla stercoraria]
MTSSTFIRNAWYVAAQSGEITDKPLGRTICNEKIVLFRSLDGIAAVEDFCPHRGAPLSLGFVQDGSLVCGYHGLEMGCNGKPQAMPLQRVQGFPCIKAYAVVEKYGFVWFWAGDKDDADESLLPHLEWAESDEWAYGGGIYHINADYRLMIDNLMDLTHETYVHASSIGQKEIDETTSKTTIKNEVVTLERHMENIYAPPFWQKCMHLNHLDSEQLVDRWQRCHFHLPSNVHIEVGVALAGNGGYHAPDDKKAASIVVDFITPETDTSHWYFWGMARRFGVDDANLTDVIREGQGKIFGEDLDMLEQQQQNLLKYPDRKLLMLNIDAGGVQARKLIERKIQAEQTVQAEG